MSDSLWPHGLSPLSCQAPLSMEFSRQEYWSGLPFPSPGDLSNLGIQFMSFVSPALACGFVTSWATREAPSLYEWTAKGQSLRLGYLIDFRIQAALLHKRCRASMTKHRKSCRSNVVSDLFFPITVSFCPLNWWGNWGSESLSHSPKVKQLSSIWKIWEFSKIGPFTPRKNTESQMECLSLIIFSILPSPSFQRKDKKEANKQKKEKTIRIYLYHWGKMKISHSLCFPTSWRINT